jgi:hypothetical protein
MDGGEERVGDVLEDEPMLAVTPSARRSALAAALWR